jgi:hypothetical protein
VRLYTEIKRRKVFRVAAVYAATAFVVLQAADLALPRLGWFLRPVPANRQLDLDRGAGGLRAEPAEAAPGIGVK